MKKIVSLLFVSIIMLVVASCSQTSTPTKAFKYYFKAFAAQDYETYVDGIYMKEGMSEEDIAKTREQYLDLFKSKGKAMIEKNQGLKDVEIQEEQLAEDGKTATIKYVMTYGDGTTDDGTQAMIKDKDGNWKLDPKK